MSDDIYFKPYDESTIDKLSIFEQYLTAWLPVFVMSGHKKLTICDLFAGAGKDSNGVPGSPLRIIRVLERFNDQIREKGVTVEVILNDNQSEVVELLKEAVDESFRCDILGRNVNFSYHCEDFQALFRSLYGKLKLQPNLIFIDQYGIKHVTEDIFQKLVCLERTDFLFFISSSFVKRFAGTSEFQQYFPDLDRNAVSEAKPSDIHRILLKYYRGKVPDGNTIKLYPFSLQKGANIYGLIFGSKHPRGVEKFLQLAWKENPTNGEANYDIDDDESKAIPTLFDMGLRTKREIFESRLEGFIVEHGEVTNRDVYYFTLICGHPPSHGKKCIVRLRKEGKVKCDAQIGVSYDACCKGNPTLKAIRTV